MVNFYKITSMAKDLSSSMVTGTREVSLKVVDMDRGGW